MAMHRMAHPDGEVATAKAAAAAGIPFVFSTMATASLAEVAQTGHASLIFQLYVIRCVSPLPGVLATAATRVVVYTSFCFLQI